MKQIFSVIFRAAALVVVCVGVAGCMKTANSTNVKAVFANPPREYSTVPLLVWNDELTEEQVVSALRDLAGQEVRQAFVHPRPGLMTPYLSDEWFRLWKIALREAKRLDMNLWIYDENSYPSGFAGGLVSDAMPQSRGRGLVMREEKLPPKWSNDIIAIYLPRNDSYENVTQKVRCGEKMPECCYLVVYILRAENSPWFGGKCYVDLLYPGVTEKFLAITMDAYRSRFGEQFGQRIPGVFTDEPHLKPVGDFHWTDDLERVFEKRWGYNLINHLPSLVRPIGEWKRVRYNYYQILLDLFIERWAKPYYNYCKRNGLEFTGHYWEHAWPACLTAPDNMAMYAWQQRPGIDTLFNQYSEDTHAQFGNIRSVKELASTANQLGRKRTLCEAYGGSGWELRFEDMKRIGDWLYVLGVNTLDEHLSHISIRGARKTDYPQSFSYHEPWWEAYHVMAGYFTLLSAALSHGEEINKVLLIEPTTTAWIYQRDPNHRGHLDRIGEEFQKMVTALSKAQVEYDIGSEYIIAKHGSIKGRQLKVGLREYETVVLPPLTENLNTKTMDMLESYLKAGGTVVCCGSEPALVDGQPSNRCYSASRNSGFGNVEPNDLPAKLLGWSKDGFAINRSPNDKGILLHHRRRLDDGELLFLTNTSIDSSTSGAIKSVMRGVEKWDPETGIISPYPFKMNKQGVEADFELAPCGSLLLFLSKKPSKAVLCTSAKTSAIISPVGPVQIRRLQSNVLTIDYFDITAGGETKKNVYYYQGSQFAFQKNGLSNNPWDHAVQFRDELITKRFPPESGFDATYRFTIENRVPDSLYIVIERPDLYTITCNGTVASAAKDSWWLDKSFGRIDIAAAARVGENVVTIKASPMTVYHELAPAYVLGKFAVNSADSGFVIVPEVPLCLGPWDKQRSPFYAAGVSYSQSFDVPQPMGQYYIRLPAWYGSVARVIVNGKPAGYIYHQPWECDVTKYISEGTNTIEVIVIGTLKNTLGPHHSKSELGRVGPDAFRKASASGPPPGSKYQTVGYGMFEPFELYVNAQ